MQGIQAVLTLNEDFELFITSKQYQVRTCESVQLLGRQ